MGTRPEPDMGRAARLVFVLGLVRMVGISAVVVAFLAAAGAVDLDVARLLVLVVSTTGVAAAIVLGIRARRRNR